MSTHDTQLNHQVDERRSVFRICVAGALIDVQIEDVEDCQLMDANSEGIGVISPESFPIGVVVGIQLRHNGTTYKGDAQVRNVQRLEDGKFRCGLQTVADDRILRRGLRQVAIDVQRERLRREAERRRGHDD